MGHSIPRERNKNSVLRPRCCVSALILAFYVSSRNTLWAFDTWACTDSSVPCSQAVTFFDFMLSMSFLLITPPQEAPGMLKSGTGERLMRLCAMMGAGLGDSKALVCDKNQRVEGLCLPQVPSSSRSNATAGSPGSVWLCGRRVTREVTTITSL